MNKPQDYLKRFRRINHPLQRFIRIWGFVTLGYWLISILVDIIKGGMALGDAMLANIYSSVFVGIFFSAFYAWWFRNHSFHISKEKYNEDFLKIESAIRSTGCTHHRQAEDAHLYTAMPRKPYLLGAVTILPDENGYKIEGPHFYIDRIKKTLVSNS